ncbi:hypothetical protein BGW39_002239 [Mortierella sp. 14UC]|nr:hypothetical protein BGW39_002239 [Mortierella sp. 14UC]
MMAITTPPVDSTSTSTSPPPTAATTTTTGSTSISSEDAPPAPAASGSAVIGNGFAPTSAFFGVSAPLATGFGSLDGSFGTAAPALISPSGGASTSTGFGSAAVSSFGAAATASFPFGAAPASTSLFGGAFASTGFGSIPIAASSNSFGSTPAQTFGAASAPFGGVPRDPWHEALETILISILERNPRLEFLVVPSHCLQSEAMVKVVAENLPELKEFYSSMDLGRRVGPSTAFALIQGCDNPCFGYSTTVLAGAIQSPLSYPLLEVHPRLVELQQGFIARINRETLDRIRSTDQNSFDFVTFGGWDLSHVSLILEELPAKTLIAFDLRLFHDRYINSENITVFLKCAPRLVHMYLDGCNIDEDIVRAILCSCPRLKTLQTMAMDHGFRPLDEVRLNGLTAFATPWISRQLEVFECKIVNIPRPDIATTEVDDGRHTIFPDPDPPLAAALEEIHAAQQQSHTFQRRVLQQLGQLTNLRALRLGRFGRDHNDPFYINLEIRGIRTMMVVDSYFQTDCLEFSLESGLAELTGLKQLEELDLTQMAHRIGMEEVRWMVEHWPSLKAVHGLKYQECHLELSNEGEDEDGFWEEAERVPEHVTWLLEQLQAWQ